MTENRSGEPPDGPTRPEHRLERIERAKGRLPGDTRVRIVRSSELRRRKGYVEATEEVFEPEGAFGRATEKVRTVLFGRRLSSEQEHEERLTKVTGLAIFASDNISSSAYATEATMHALALAGAGALALTMPLTVAIVVILAIVVISYLQVIKAYPNGGGSYVVASENLGRLPGLVAAAALLVDYVLTVSVSVAGGVLAITSARPDLDPYKVTIGVVFIGLLTIGNLRGIREAGVLFAGPTYFYVLSVFGVLAIGLYRMLMGDLPAPVPPPAVVHQSEALSAFLILRAFSSGSVALTGTEAVANGVPAFRKPESVNARIVLVAMGTLFGTLFIGISFLSTHIGLQPDASETQSILSMLTRSLVGDGWYFYVVQIATAVILTLAANTSFSGFPRLASILATDRFMPRQFAQRGDRLAYSFGIIVLAVLSAILLAVYQASVNGLIPLYTIGVFIAFTLSQAGLVRHWLRQRGRGWRFSIGVNALGAVATGIVAVVVTITKFALGAWLVLAVMPVLVYLMWRVHRHYRKIEDELLIPRGARVALRARAPRLIVPISRIDKAALHALSLARGLSPHVTALHISFDEDGAQAFKDRWARSIGSEVPIEVIVSPYRSLIAPMLSYLDAIDDQDHDRPIVVVLAEFVPRHFWDAALHNQTALRLKLALFARPNTSVIDVPYHLGDTEDFESH
ncbi:MAG TPA: APC family permease [Candidatus Limnocylindria bacterium]|nr:APC family permease [Candidatus Limnocylindria bacterium]